MTRTGFKLSSTFMAILFLNGCATVHGVGNYAMQVLDKTSPDLFTEKVKNPKKEPTTKGLLLSASENVSLSSEYFTLIDFTFENKSSDWLRVSKVAVDFGGEAANAQIRFPVGQDLMDWAQSAQQVKAIRDYNTQIALATVTGVAAGVASSNGSKSSSNMASAAAVGSGMVLAANTLNNKLDSLQRSKVIPEDHLLSGPFSVPPGLPKKKWITLYAKDPLGFPFVRNMVVTLTYENGNTESLVFNVRDILTTSSHWQKKHPELIEVRKAALRR